MIKKRVDVIKWQDLMDTTGNNYLRENAKKCFYPIIVESDNYRPEKQTIEKDGRFYVYPIDSKNVERKWRYARQSVEKIQNPLWAKIIKSKNDNNRERERERERAKVDEILSPAPIFSRQRKKKDKKQK